MPKYNSLFASPESVQEKWGVIENEAEKLCALWELAYDEVRNTPKPNDVALVQLITDAQTFLRQKPRVFDAPDDRYTQVQVSITQDQWTRLVNTYAAVLLMRAIAMGSDAKRKSLSTMWGGIKGKEKGNVDAAIRTAKKFNDIYAADEFWNYLQYLAGKTKNLSTQKPYVPEQKKLNLYLWSRA
jgi:hypothetical protein